jgi:cytochrome c-type biogenesis protein CcmH
MLFWIIAASLTLLACLAVLLPMARTRTANPGDASHDIEVYRDQLAELERDTARGTIGAAEAEQARTEIARRILKAEAERGAEVSAGGTRAGRAIATAAVLAIPVVAWSVYASTGSPELPAQPLQARLDKNPADSTIDELVARAEKHLSNNPSDGRGWDVLAPIYVRLDRHQDAAIAYRNAMRLLGATAAREIGLGDAITAAQGGLVTTEAQAAFQRALALAWRFGRRCDRRPGSTARQLHGLVRWRVAGGQRRHQPARWIPGADGFHPAMESGQHPALR